MQGSRPKIWDSFGINEEDREKRRGWAFDLGSEFQVFPIVVEDLEHPGQMLIEVSCYLLNHFHSEKKKKDIAGPS